MDNMDKELKHAPRPSVDAVAPENVEAQMRANEGLKQELNTRHLTFISIGAVIGTGIFLGIGQTLTESGPVGLVLAYTVICSVVFCVMLCVGEMVTYLPVVGAHLRLSGRFVDPSLSAAMSWNYWYCWSLIAAAEASAIAVLVTYWTEAVPAGAWIAISLAVFLGVNLCGPRVYAEIEFYVASIKVLTIVGLIILSLVLNAGGGPNHDYIGFRYWKHPGPFVQYKGIGGATGRFLAFFSGLTGAAFSSIGAEMLALVAAETRHPRKIVPTALRATWVRIVLFYFMGAFCVSIIVASDNNRLGSASTAAASPYVIAIQEAGIRALPSIINACILTSALSAGISDVFTATRTLHSMAGSGLAPRFFHATTRWGCPWRAVLATWSLSLLAFLAVGSTSISTFNFFVNLTSLAGIITWLCIGITYLRFRAGMRAQGIPHASLPYRNRFSVIGAYWTIGVITVVLIFSGWPVFRKGGWSTSKFFSNYLPPFIFAVVYAFFKLYTKSRFVTAADMDLTSGLDEIERVARRAEEEDEMLRARKGPNRLRTFLQRLVA